MISESLLHLARSVLRPVIKVLVRRGLNFQNFVALGKELYIQTAADEIARRGEAVNLSRLGVMTGIHRIEIAKSVAARPLEIGDRPISTVGSIIGMWLQRAEYCHSVGEPRPLRFRGNPNEFKQLVAAVDPKIEAHEALFQLEQLEFVRRRGDQLILIKEHSDVQKDAFKAYDLLRHGLDDLLSAGLENLEAPAPTRNLHLHTEFDNIFSSDVPHIREWLLKEGRELHRRARDYIARFDADLSPDLDRERREPNRERVVLNAFSFTSPKLPASEVSIASIAQNSRRGRPRKTRRESSS